ncbi:MAG TPA: ADP-ribosyltransferase [Candidatus Saccharimonadales bacterium]|nr:ADP-ribosyltransferase [Candidatus Saccharimonadales bacterium]
MIKRRRGLKKRKCHFGPTMNTQYCKIPIHLQHFIQKCDKYINTLSLFHQYCLFRYTVGSKSINMYLINKKIQDDAVTWCQVFFDMWHNTSTNPNHNIPVQYIKYTPFFLNPEEFSQLNDDQQKRVSTRFIKTYVNTLQRIILKGPVVTGKGFDVFKISIKYDALHQIKSLPSLIKQYPFNSTTVNMYFNFVVFTTLSSTCCLFKIHIPAGSHVLWLSSRIHSYPFEKEILLPFGCVFKINHIHKSILNYINPKDMNIIPVQKKNFKMGNLYVLDASQPCINHCNIQSKLYTVYDCIYKNRNS